MDLDKKMEPIRSFLGSLGFEANAIEAGINALTRTPSAVTQIEVFSREGKVAA